MQVNAKYTTLSGSVGSWKYCCRYFGKIVKNNYCTVYIYADGRLIRRAIVLLNTRCVTYYKFQQSEQEINKTGNIFKGHLSVPMKSSTTFWSIHNLLLIRILLWSKRLCWKQELESHYKILTNRQRTISLNLMLMSIIIPKK